MTQGDIATRLSSLRQRIAAAASRAGRRPEEVTLLGVAKRKSAEIVAEAIRAGLRDVGENYVQEATAKLAALGELPSADSLRPRWHFVGALQRNKARFVAENFDVVQTLDRPALGAALERHAAAADRRLDVLLQIDVSDEPQKGGVPPEEAAALLEASRSWPHLRVAGLMSIPAAGLSESASRVAFATLRELCVALRESGDGAELRELSMGMSGDFEMAIEEGATIVRIGTALFGPRD